MKNGLKFVGLMLSSMGRADADVLWSWIFEVEGAWVMMLGRERGGGGICSAEEAAGG